MRTPLLLSSLIALGVLPLLPEPRTQEDLDREDAERRERVRSDLVTRGLDPEEVRAAVGSGRFVEMGRAVLAAAKQHAEEFGTQPPLSELLGIVADLEAAHRRLREMALHEPLEEAQQVGFATSKQAMVSKTSFVDGALMRGHRAGKSLNGAAWLMERMRPKARQSDGPRFVVDYGALEARVLETMTGGIILPVHDSIEITMREHPDRNRQAQREARKVRKAAKARRGW